MNMFCYQCQETAGGTGCTKIGVCGKKDDVACLQDLLLYTIKGIAQAEVKEEVTKEIAFYIVHSLFQTITNANFNSKEIIDSIKKGLVLRNSLISKFNINTAGNDYLEWYGENEEDFLQKAGDTGILKTEDEDVRSLRELITYGLKGMAAYFHHAMALGYYDEEIPQFMIKALQSICDDRKKSDELLDLTIECGKYGVAAMQLLDRANTETFGNPEITEVKTDVGTRPGILVSGHDLLDLKELLEQTKDSGIDIYTHSEMLPAHYYPLLKQYAHLYGNYGTAWHNQRKEFVAFNGPILFTTNCLVPPLDEYKDRVYTTGAAGFQGCLHIPERKPGGTKDFSKIISHAKKCKPPISLETPSITGGFAHNQVVSLADKVVEAVKSGAVRKFVVMAGCDGRQKGREYYTQFAEELPKDTIILTAGCAKYRYNMLQLGDIGGIPRVLDAGQCNDSYSLAVIALKLQEVFALDDVNDLPIVFNIAWYEQKAVIVLLALLSLGFKNIHIGPTLPAFLSSNVTKILVSQFGIGGINDVPTDIKAFLG